ncbi:MAG: electron transfer flavoprotein subunit alpha/FixB family protein [Hyphomicrobiales bacterium]|nr:electron transfer flavoprotein subunit alpha/FixB family protein [Hyphomicrobiales bacterium]
MVVAVVLSGARDRLVKGERRLLGFARDLAGEDGATLACLPGPAPGLAGAGADRVFTLAAPGTFWADAMARLLGARMADGTIHRVVLPDDTDGRHMARRLAAALDLPCMVGVHEVSQGMARRPACGESMVLCMPVPPVMTVRAGMGRPVTGARYEARAMDLKGDADGSSPVRDLGFVDRSADEIELEEAPFILSGGAGVSDWDTFAAVARMLNATRAGSRVVCDAGHLPRDRQVGASGRLVTADCYVALGISGAIQHLQGIEGCAHVVAVNSDPHASIVNRADVTFVADANAVLASLVKRLEARS